MVVWLILLALRGRRGGTPVPPEVGIGENNDTLFADPLFPDRSASGTSASSSPMT